MMLRSWSNTLISVRQVTQRNAGRGTPGVDGQVVLTARARMDLAVQVHRTARSFQPLPVRRVYIPKANGKQRPLGIPAITDRAHQARCRNALEPEWEARFAPRTYGFRPGRSCQDAISVIHVMGCGKNPRRRWILDADLTAAFDRIDHGHLLAKLGSFPGKGMIRGWLKAGVFEKGKGFAPTDEGTPQGGCDFTLPSEYRAPWAGGSGRSPLRGERSCSHETRLPGPGGLRRRTWSPCATPGSRPSRSRHAWPGGWPPGACPSTRPRHAS